MNNRNDVVKVVTMACLVDHVLSLVTVLTAAFIFGFQPQRQELFATCHKPMPLSLTTFIHTLHDDACPTPAPDTFRSRSDDL